MGELTKTMDFRTILGNTLVSKLNSKYNLKEFEWTCPGKLDYVMPRTHGLANRNHETSHGYLSECYDSDEAQKSPK